MANRGSALMTCGHCGTTYQYVDGHDCLRARLAAVQSTEQRYRDALEGINVDGWAHLAHLHVADEGTVGTMARALATAIQIADDALEGR